MLTIAIFTFKRFESLLRCTNSIQSKHVGEILIFNDDEDNMLQKTDFNIDYPIRVFNPITFGFEGRKFRKPMYINKAINLSKYDKILFTDDDGVFNVDTIDLHHKYLQNYKFVAGSIIRSKFIKRKSKNILQGTNYSFDREFLLSVGGYNELFSDSSGGGDPEFWYRIYNFVSENKIPVVYLYSAVQQVIGIQSRDKREKKLTPCEVFESIHNFRPKGKMYNWFPEIRKKSNWMTTIR
ncbi:MAG: hypothetical protein ISS00_00970 [Candidatus Marinimicrobia bacterium]|nr:hypothetical protein [Candidatus Neomarinimicrobiota bacterium]